VRQSVSEQQLRAIQATWIMASEYVKIKDEDGGRSAAKRILLMDKG